MRRKAGAWRLGARGEGWDRRCPRLAYQGPAGNLALGIEGRGTEIWGSAEAGAGVKALTPGTDWGLGLRGELGPRG